MNRKNRKNDIKTNPPWSGSRVPRGFWQDPQNRLEAVEWLVEQHKIPPQKITASDFIKNGLSGILAQHSGSPARAVLEYVMANPPAPRELWKKKSIRSAAVRMMVEKSGKDPKKITLKDFKNAGLTDMLAYTGNSHETAIRETGYGDGCSKPSKARAHNWADRDVRARAVRDMIEHLKKPLSDITVKDFRDHGLGTVITRYGPKYRLFREAGFELKPWEVKKSTMGLWEGMETRVSAVSWLVEKMKKPVTEISREDFVDNGLATLLAMYNPKKCKDYKKTGIIETPPGYLLEYPNAVARALAEAGFLSGEDEKKMKLSGKVRASHWFDRDNRIAALKEIVDDLGKPPEKITQKELERANLVYMIHVYYGNRKKAFVDAGFDYDETEANQRPPRYWQEPRNRAREVRSMVKGSGKDPKDIVSRDFKEAGIEAVLHNVPNVHYALREAGFNLLPWEMSHVPKGFWYEERNRIMAVKWLVHVTGRKPKKITRNDYIDNGLDRLFQIYPKIRQKDPGFSRYYNIKRDYIQAAMAEAELV